MASCVDRRRSAGDSSTPRSAYFRCPPLEWDRSGTVVNSLSTRDLADFADRVSIFLDEVAVAGAALFDAEDPARVLPQRLPTRRLTSALQFATSLFG